MTSAARPEVLGVRVRDDTWFRRLSRRTVVQAGGPAPRLLRVPAGDAQKILRSTVRLVADLPRDSTPEVVWAKGDSELVVHTSDIGLTCATGLVTIRLRVDCDQVADHPARSRTGVAVEVPLAVGTERAPTGLVMSTLHRPTGPTLVVDEWGDPLTAFAWESLLHLAQALCAEVGSDSSGRALVPGHIAAARSALLLQPMARHA